jgi:hypothetical protein
MRDKVASRGLKGVAWVKLVIILGKKSYLIHTTFQADDIEHGVTFRPKGLPK